METNNNKGETITLLQLRHLHYEITHLSKIKENENKIVNPDFYVVPKSSVKYNYVLELQNEAREGVWKICSKIMLSETNVGIYTKENNDWVKVAKLKYTNSKQESFQIKMTDSSNLYKILFEEEFSKLSIIMDSNQELVAKFRSFKGRIGSAGGLLNNYSPEKKGLIIAMTVAILWIQESVVYLLPHRPLNTEHVYELMRLNRNIMNRKSQQYNNGTFLRSTSDKEKKSSREENTKSPKRSSATIRESREGHPVHPSQSSPPNNRDITLNLPTKSNSRNKKTPSKPRNSKDIKSRSQPTVSQTPLETPIIQVTDTSLTNTEEPPASNNNNNKNTTTLTTKTKDQLERSESIITSSLEQQPEQQSPPQTQPAKLDPENTTTTTDTDAVKSDKLTSRSTPARTRNSKKTSSADQIIPESTPTVKRQSKRKSKNLAPKSTVDH